VTVHIRLVADADAAQIQAIYAPIVEETHISFEYEVPTVEEMAKRIQSKVIKYPWLVAERADGMILGYAYAGAWRERTAYSWVTETTIYTHEAARRTGVARGLYTALFGALRTQGFCQAIAGIAQPNAASVYFHEALGFRYAGQHPKTGYKFGRWIDMAFWQLELQAPPETPAPTLETARAARLPAWRAALHLGETLIRPTESLS
jgi:phosphinothricin acetyltransferase